jgi:L-iditol 2-dehydrogenase
LHVIVTRQAGAAPVIACDRHALKLAAARAAGAHHVVDITSDSPAEVVRGLTDGRGPDVVIEAVGRPEAWAQAVQLVRPGGNVLFFGGCPPDATVALDTKRVHYEELTLRGAFHHTPMSVRRAFRMLVRDQIAASVLITAHLPLRQAEVALRSMIAGQSLKVALTPT